LLHKYFKRMVGIVNQVLSNYSLFRPNYRVLCLMILVSGAFKKASGQEAISHKSIKGTPRVIHYTRKDFNSDPQIWTMCQDKEGILYFGSNSGALIYDGETWQNAKLPNNSSIRSLAVSNDGV